MSIHQPLVRVAHGVGTTKQLNLLKYLLYIFNCFANGPVLIY